MSLEDGAEFYDADPISQVAINLFYGWGYNFYRVENQIRADDLLVRHQVAGILGEARVAITDAEHAYREANLPPLSRDHPRPDPDALKTARVLELLVARVGAIASRIRSLPVPENDRISQRHRQEADTLVKLLQADMRLTGHAETLSRALRHQVPEWMVQHVEDITHHIQAVEAAMQDRQSILNL